MSVAVVVARSLRDALWALAQSSENSRVLAGGTDLMVELRSGRTQPDLVVDVWKLGELRGIRREQGGLRLGALTTCAELARSDAVREHADILALAASEVGAEQIQNRATIGGNLGTASPAADLTPVLLALEARVRLVAFVGERELPLEQFFLDYRRTARRPEELIESVFVPAREPGERRAFRKVGTRRAQSISKLVVALALRVEDGRIAFARAAAGSVAPTTIRLRHLERTLEGAAPSPAVLDRAAVEGALRDARPIDDVRSTAAYRRHALRRVLATLLGELTGPAQCPT